MSRTLQTALIFLCLTFSAYNIICSCNELWDLLWKVAHQ